MVLMRFITSHITTLEGVMQKEVVTDNKNHEFYVPQEIKGLVQ